METQAVRGRDLLKHSLVSCLAASEDSVVEGDPDVQIANLPVERVFEPLNQGADRIVLRRS